MSIYNDHKPDEGTTGLYLKLKDGDGPKLRIMSEPAISVYKQGDRPRYAWIVYNHDLKKVQIYGAGVSVYSQISALVDDWGEPTGFDIRVKREGSGMQDTSYLVTPIKNSTEPPKEAVAEAEKIDLPKDTKGKWLEQYVEDSELPEPIFATDAEGDDEEPLPPLPEGF